MSTVTPFLNLVKPAPLEAFSRATYNNNLDLVDAGVKALSDRRKHAEYSNPGFIVNGGFVQWDAGPLTNDGNNTFNNTFANVTGAPSGGINITETGLYQISALTVPDASPGKAIIIIKVGSFFEAFGFTDGTPWETSASVNKYITSGTVVQVILKNTTGRTHVTRLRVTKVMN